MIGGRNDGMWWVLGAVAALGFLPAVVRAAPPPAGEWSPERLAAAQEGQVDFWPQRVDPDRDAQVFVQLARPADLPQACVRCGKELIELGPPAWSHPEGLLHAFDLEWTIPRQRLVCDLFVRSGSGPLVRAPHHLNVRPRGVAPTIARQEVTWSEGTGEAILELEGTGFGDEVSVLWVSASTFSAFERAARVERTGKKDRVVTPFSASLRKAGAGQYLVVVLNEDRTAAVAPDFFTVTERAEPEVDFLRVVSGKGGTRLLVSGFDLDRLTGCVLKTPSGELPLNWVRVEESEGVLVSLPVGTDAETVARGEVRMSGARLFLVPHSERVSGSDPPDALQ
ncbi:MAG: hypothetical protein FJ109_08255 [Deltaproteobacteria bacterium]|nr:hypothetical protein [Deltaproteobacteria bacterium]